MERIEKIIFYQKLIFILIVQGISLGNSKANQTNTYLFSHSNSFLKGGVYTNNEKGYSIQFPLWWKVEEADRGNKVKASRPSENSKEQFQERVAVSLVETSETISLKTFFEENLKGLH